MPFASFKLFTRPASSFAGKVNFDVPFNFVAGKRVFPSSAQPAFDVFEPATGSKLISIQCSDSRDVDCAVQAASGAFPGWKALSGIARAQILRKAAALLRERTDEIARLEVIDTGKPFWEAKWDIQTAYDSFEYFAGLAPTLSGQHINLGSGNWAYTIREPLGIVGAIGAWNYPIQIASWKIAPALACGNCVVFKPSPVTPLSAVVLAEILTEAGLPKGALNIVQGEAKTGTLLTQHPGVSKITFTGSVPTGKQIAKSSADTLKRVTLELGGKSPVLVFEDCHLLNAVKGAVMANFLSQGEVCNNGTRVFVQESVHDAFVDHVLQYLNKIKLGDPQLDETTMGALISQQHLDNVQNFLRTARDEGATVHGGDIVKLPGLEKGYFMKPSVVTDCSDNMTVVKEEVFGPVMSILKFQTEDEAISRANATDYGLAGGVFTMDVQRAHRVVAALQGGVQWVNNYNTFTVELPFGGMKQSGYGRENGIAAIEHFTDLKTVYMEQGDVWTPYDD